MRLTPVGPAVVAILCAACGGAGIALALVSLTYFSNGDPTDRHLQMLSTALVAIPLLCLAAQWICCARHRRRRRGHHHGVGPGQ